MLFGKTPGYIRIALGEDTGLGDGGQGLGDVGSGETIADDLGSNESVSDSFFAYDFGDDAKGEFKTKEELEKEFRQHYMRHSDYTKKTQSLSEERKAFQREKEKIEAEQTAFLNAKSKYDQWEKLLETIPEDQFQKMLQEVSQKKLDPEVAALKAELDEIKKGKQSEEEARKSQESQKAIQAQRDSAARALKSVYPDFDAEKVTAKIEELMNEPENLQMQTLMEMVHLHLSGQKPPAPPKRSPYSGTGQPNLGTPKSSGSPASWDAAAEMAKKEFGE